MPITNHLFIFNFIFMSSYNENLHSNVISSLQTQELELQKVKAKRNASMFSLYYAEAATIKASEQLELTADVFQKKMDTKTQAVANSNISNNLLGSANQAATYVKQSINNSAVCAANIQLAANAIVRLASDLGSIYSIVHAADAKSDIYLLAEESRTLINQTAYDAELTSQVAMEVSMLASEVTASTVQEKAKANNELMNNVLKIVSDEFTAVSQLALAEDVTLASTSVVEKQAEGNYLDLTIDYNSTKAAYQSANIGLNLGLEITNKTSSGFTINFNRITMPFAHQQNGTQNAAFPYYPVKKYYFVIVKDAKKSTFSISNAENLLIGDMSSPATASNVPATASDATNVQKNSSNPKRLIIPVTDKAKKTTTTADNAQAATDQSDEKTKVEHNISQAINFQEMMIDNQGPFTIQDSDGDDIKLGTRYVVFVLALYTDDYKKKLNCFDDYLSAPSPSFKLTNKLAAVDGSTITIPQDQKPTAAYDYQLNFTVVENPDNAGLVEYRCIFLPPNNPWAGLLLNNESTDAFKQEVDVLEGIAETFDPKIAEAEANAIAVQNYLSVLQSNLSALQADEKTTTDDDTETPASNANQQADAKTIQDRIDTTQSQIDEQKELLTYYQKRQSDMTKEMNDKIKKIHDVPVSGKVGFLFNLKIAEQVLAGNFITATKSQQSAQADAGSTKKTKSNTTDASADVVSWDVNIKIADVTDNFGNPLIAGQLYTPVILSYCTANEENLCMFTNSWSGYSLSKPFVIPKK